MSEHADKARDRIIQVLAEELEQAKQGKIGNLVLISTGDNYESKRAEIFTDAPGVMLGHLKEMGHWLAENQPPQ